MSRGTFTAIKTEGGLLPREVLERVAAEDTDLPGMEQQAYHLPPNERLGEAINRSWNRLLGLWEAYSDALKGRGENDAATGLTRDRWLLPLFDELGYGRLQRSTAVEIEGKSFAISHAWYRTSIHLVGAGVSIDKRSAGVAGAAAAAPHSLVQEFLNRSEEHLWAFVSNGRLLRILRDNHSLSRQAYVEFDLEAIMDGELFSDFRVLWLVCHQSRVEAEEPEDCLLEAWFQQSREEGVRALDALRDGVERAIEAFGSGFLRHPANGRLHEGLRSGELDRQDYYRELLRLVYRLIFLFVAEDRDALLDPDAPPEARQRYTKFYASNRLRELAGRRRGTAHDDQWRGLRLVLSELHDGRPELGLPALGSFLWSPEAVDWIGDAELRNDDLLAALRALSYTTQDHQLLPVNWRTLGSEELGSVYESLLELHPKMNREAGTFELDTAAGHERKTTGSYYTPTSLVDRLLDSALEPVLEEAMRADDPEAALMDLKVCDTAAGSGHFLVAAARRIALRVASVRTGDEEASPEAVTHALRDVVGRCIYGVDLNPLAVELCKVSLWMEALEPGKPLSFLDHHIQLGNSLLGTTPHLLREGIPDDAFKEIEGDDKKVVRDLRKQNRDERKSEQIGFQAQLEVAERGGRYGAIDTLLNDLNQADDSTLEAVRQKEARYRRLVDDPRYRTERLAADAWCAAFVWRKTEKAPPAVTEDLFRQIQRQPDEVPGALAMEVRRLAERYRFFHFHMAFPDVFHPAADQGEQRAGWRGGFDAVVGNPPWERTAFEDKQFFAQHAPEILEAPTTSARKRAIAALEVDDPPVFEAYQEARRQADGETHLYKDSGRFPLGASGRINTYALFADLTLDLLNSSGRAGIIVPTGIATDTPMEGFWSTLVAEGRLVSIYDFENRERVFPAVHSSYRFSLLTLRSPTENALETVRCAFFLRSADEIDEKAYTLSIGDLALINPITRQPPTCRTQKDVELLVRLHRHPKTSEVFGGAVSGWVAFTSSGYSEHYLQRQDLVGPAKAVYGLETEDGKPVLPLFEGKLMHQFDCRFATYEGVSEGDRRSASPRSVDQERETTEVVVPRFWAPQQVVSEFLQRKGMDRDWLIGIRDNTNATNERTTIVAILPRGGMIQPLNGITVASARDALWLTGALNSFALDYAARQKVPGTHLNVTIFSQLPVPERSNTALDELVERLALELSTSVPGLSGFSREAGFDGRTYGWDEDRRFLLRAELDAAFFHLYGAGREDTAFIMETFPIVRRKDKKAYGEYRTKRLILEAYDAIVLASQEGRPYESRLDPEPATAH